MKTYKELKEMMVAAALGSGGGFGAASDSKGLLLGYDLPFGGMIKRWYTAQRQPRNVKGNE